MRCPVCKTPHDRLAVACACGHRFPAVSEPGRRAVPKEAAPREASARTARDMTPVPRLPAERRARGSGELVRRVPKADHSQDMAPRFTGDPRALLGLHVVNLAKALVTGGVYYFWAKVQVRKYLYAHTSFRGDRFAYHGEGKELLLGWAKVGGIFAAIGAFSAWLEWGLKIPGAGLVGQALFFLVGVLLFPLAMVGSTRFRLSRTSWRGIRFSFHGRARECAALIVGGLIRNAFTFGFYTPFLQVRTRRFMVANTRFGDLAFGFDGDAKPLVGPYIVSTLLYMPSLTLSSFWYKAIRDKHLWHHTTIGEARFVCTVTPGGLFKLWIRQLLLVYATFGIGKPWYDVIKLRYLCENLRIEGPLDVDGVVQRIQRANTAGEGLTDFVEVGFFDFEVGL